VPIQNENDYEDLLSLWSDLESGLGIVLGNPDSIQEFEQRIWQYDRWMRDLVEREPDLGLYLLFQLAANSPVGYSASHALICSVLCDLTVEELGLPKLERDSLVHAAMTMNMSMTTSQDELAEQMEKKPSLEQQNTIDAHPANSAMMLRNLGVNDELWLDTVRLHHDEAADRGDLRTTPAATRLARILRNVDRYAAMISPRRSREGRSATDSMLAIIARSTQRHDEVGHALERVIGLYPPGTYVRLDNSELAVVVSRSGQPNQPDIAIAINEDGSVLNPPRLHRTANGSPKIKTALPAAAVHTRLNHHQILRLV
jgi:hypothetical protein